MTLRLFVGEPLERPPVPPARIELPPRAVRHLQVRRLQPGDAVTVFDGSGGEWQAEVETIGRTRASVRLVAHLAVAREPSPAVTLAVGMPANERMDWLVEKAAEIGAAAVVPLLTERSVLRLAGERAALRREHWQSVAEAAAEQSGATRITEIATIRPLVDWLAEAAAAGAARRALLAIPAAGAVPAGMPRADASAVLVLSGPEGGLSEAEQAAAQHAGFVPWCLGPRTLRAETAPLVALARLLA